MTYSSFDEYGFAVDSSGWATPAPEIPTGVEFFSSVLEATYVQLDKLKAEVRALTYEAEVRAERHKTKIYDAEQEISRLNHLISDLQLKREQQAKEAQGIQDNLDNSKENHLLALDRLIKAETSADWYREAWQHLLAQTEDFWNEI